jgi:hypothetical protein
MRWVNIIRKIVEHLCIATNTQGNKRCKFTRAEQKDTYMSVR